MATTYQDVLDHITSWKQVSVGRPYQQARRAVLEAYRDLPFKAAFTRFERKVMLVAEEEEDTGTVSYNHQTRVVTISGATWPTNVVNHRIVINDGVFHIVERYSDTEIRLRRYDNPGTDYPSGTTYRLVKDCWKLPDDFRRVVSVVDVGGRCNLPVEGRFSTNDLAFLNGLSEAGQPRMAYVTGGGEWGGSYLYVTPPPASDIRLSVTYDAQPKPLLIDTFCNGTVALTSGSTTATFTLDSTVTLPATISNGAILRVSLNNNIPTGPLGRLDNKNQEVVNPADYEFIITERLSNTTVRLAEAATATVSGKLFTISDVIDLDDVAVTALMRTAEANYVRMTMQGNEGYSGLQRMADEYALEALRFAKENDRRINSERNAVVTIPMWRRPVGERVVIG